MPESVQRVAFEEAKRAIVQQQESLDSLQTRAAVLFTAAAVSLSLFGVAGSDKLAVRVITGMLFGVVAFLTISLMAPRTWTFSNDVTQLIRKVDADPELSADVVFRNLALFMQKHWNKNQDQLNEMMGRYRVGCWLLLTLVLVGALGASF